MTTYPLPTLAFQVTPTGITAPSYSDVYQSLQASFQSIYGSDSYLDPDSQDGQMLAVFAQGITDTNNAAIALFNAYSPSTAQGAGLSSSVKINGLARLVPTNSTVDLIITGVAGTTITNGIVEDINGNQWLLPPSIIITQTGTITVTATSANAGAIAAAPSTITSIVTATIGWQTVTNPSAATPGAPVETDAALRVRQANSTSLPAKGILASIYAAVANLSGVEQLKIFENDTSAPDANGLPDHSIAVVVAGGDATAIAQTIELKKGPGCGTYGTTTVLVEDSTGLPININFFVPTQIAITVVINLTPLAGYTSTIGTAVINAIINAINALGINANAGLLSVTSLYNAAYGSGNANTYNINSIHIARYPNSPSFADLAIAFNEIPTCSTGNVTLNIL